MASIHLKSFGMVKEIPYIVDLFLMVIAISELTEFMNWVSTLRTDYIVHKEKYFAYGPGQVNA